jgi:IS605 OrfB family transposase
VSQCLDLTELRREVEWLADLPAQTGQQVLADLDVAWQRCWAGLGGEPALKRRRNPMGLRFPQGVEVRRLNRRWGAVRLPKLGEVRFRWTRDLPGQLRHATVSGSGDRWQVAFCLEVEVAPVEPNRLPPAGVDRGVEVAFMTSDGEAFDRAMWRPKERERLLRLERLKAVKQRGSYRYQRTCRQIANLHRRASERRHDFAHKVSTQLAKNHGLVAIEALVVPNLTRSARGTVEEPGRNVAAKTGLNRAILDKGWGLVSGQLRYKCPRYGSALVEVPAQNTSLICPVCGLIDPANRPMRAVFLCVGCGHQDHADRNAAINIRERGVRLAPAGGQPVAGRKASKRLRTWRQPAQEAVA